MRILAIGDLHGYFEPAKALVSHIKPDVLLCCGDWGDPGQVRTKDLEWLIERTHVLSVFGNHDDIELLLRLNNRDESPILLFNGETRRVGSITVAGISGIWAKSHHKPWYITDEEVADYAISSRQADVLITHACASGLADSLPGGRHAGQRCFLDAFELVQPKVYLCGHLHSPQMRKLKNGSFVANVGTAALGDCVIAQLSENNEWNVELAKGKVEAGSGR